MSDITRGDWVKAFLTRCGYKVTVDNGTGMLTWIRAEWGGASPIPATYNPLSVVMPLNGSTKFNRVGVQMFKTFEDGVEATAQTLLNGDYLSVRLALIAGDDDFRLISAIAASRWGSKPTQNFLDYTKQNLADELALPIGPASVPNVPAMESNDMIMCPNKPALPNGRQPFAVLDIPNRRVLLFNGASLGAPDYPDHAVGDYRVWPVPATHALLGMDRTRNPVTKQYDDRGIVIGAADGGSFQALWS